MATSSPYRTPARPEVEPPPPGPTFSIEVIAPVLLVWLACVLRVGAVAFGGAEPNREVGLALFLVVVLSALIAGELAVRRRMR